MGVEHFQSFFVALSFGCLTQVSSLATKLPASPNLVVVQLTDEVNEELQWCCPEHLKRLFLSCNARNISVYELSCT